MSFNAFTPKLKKYILPNRTREMYIGKYWELEEEEAKPVPSVAMCGASSIHPPLMGSVITGRHGAHEKCRLQTPCLQIDF